MSTLGDDIFETMGAVTREHADKLIAQGKIERLEKVNAVMLAALTEIRDHWACQYDHPKKASEMYAGPYGIGVTDGHRLAAEIARKAIDKAERER